MIDDPRDQKLNLIKINHCLCIRALAATIRWPDFRYPQFGPLLKGDYHIYFLKLLLKFYFFN